MVQRARAHIMRLRPATGATASLNFNLNPGSRLLHVAVSMTTSEAPLRVQVTLIQPRAASNIFSRLIGGWVRGSTTNPAGSHDLMWDGDLEIDTDMALRFVARNDTGSSKDVACTFLVFE